ncbi:hypothetical protein QA645_31980 [Bradyrhizobium sp. CIAT3101]|uniref:hypothetical protein n=1 Tax=Bradyrhizobium sp. CIAT3101 TaxID=439387 RepID=UPI0024B160E8|nr:hypothetical protein [Bradyrhizobium sp. CIAT3101]WFU79115.1 hypothetical protein QA645_31980 [Bradyrhizobium sp. CIAT3101]
MSSAIEHDLSELAREIAQRQQLIEDQLALIEVLERDGHDVGEQEMALQKERSRLALQIARQFELLQKRLPT